VALGPAQGEQAQEAAPGQQRDQGQGAHPQLGHQLVQGVGGGHLVQVGQADDLAGAEAGQGQDVADLGVGLDDVVGHPVVGEAGHGPQDQVAGRAGRPQDGPGRPHLRLEAGQGHLGQPLQAGRPDDLGRQVAQALQRLHAAGQVPPHRLQVAGHRAQLVVDAKGDRGLQVAAGQPARGRAQGVGRGPDRPAQPEGQQDQRGQHHQGGPHGQGLGGLIGPVLVAGIAVLGPGQLVLEPRLELAELLEMAVGPALGLDQGGRPRPCRRTRSSVCPVRTQARYSAATCWTSGGRFRQRSLRAFTRLKPSSARTWARIPASNDAWSPVSR
jgi:hypothetical protein